MSFDSRVKISRDPRQVQFGVFSLASVQGQPCLGDRSLQRHSNISSSNFTAIMATKSIPLRLRVRRNPILYSTRPYHSHDHPPPPGPFTQVESTILSAATPHIPNHGFTRTSLALGGKDCGYIDASTNLFPKGAFSLVHWHLYSQRMALAKHKNILEKEGEGVGKKVKALTWERLMVNQEIVHRWQEVCCLAIESVKGRR